MWRLARVELRSAATKMLPNFPSPGKQKILISPVPGTPPFIRGGSRVCKKTHLSYIYMATARLTEKSAERIKPLWLFAGHATCTAVFVTEQMIAASELHVETDGAHWCRLASTSLIRRMTVVEHHFPPNNVYGCVDEVVLDT